MWVMLASLLKGEKQSREASSLHLGQGAAGGGVRLPGPAVTTLAM